MAIGYDLSRTFQLVDGGPAVAVGDRFALTLVDPCRAESKDHPLGFQYRVSELNSRLLMLAKHSVSEGEEKRL